MAALTSLDFLFQTNKFNKTADRAVLFTDKFIYKLDPKKGFKPMKAAIPITDVSLKRVSQTFQFQLLLRT